MAVFIHCCHSDMPRNLVPPAVFPRPPGVWDSHLLVTSHPWEPKDPPKGQLDLVQEDCPFPWKWFHNHFWCSKLWPMFEPETVRKMMINLKILGFLQRPQKHPTYWSSLIRHQGSFCRFCATSSRSCHSAFCFFTSSCFCDKKKSPTQIGVVFLVCQLKESPQKYQSTWFWREPLNDGKGVPIPNRFWWLDLRDWLVKSQNLRWVQSFKSLIVVHWLNMAKSFTVNPVLRITSVSISHGRRLIPHSCSLKLKFNETPHVQSWDPSFVAQNTQLWRWNMMKPMFFWFTKLDPPFVIVRSPLFCNLL